MTVYISPEENYRLSQSPSNQARNAAFFAQQKLGLIPGAGQLQSPQNQFMLGTLGGPGYGPNPLGTAGPGGSVSQHNQRVQQIQPMQRGRMQPMEQLRGGIFGGRGGSRYTYPTDVSSRRFPQEGNFGPDSIGRGNIDLPSQDPQEIARQKAEYQRYLAETGGREVEPLRGIKSPPPQEIGDILPERPPSFPGGPPRPSPWQPPGRRRMPQPNQGYGDRFGGLQFSGPFAQPMMPRNYGMGGGYGRRPMPMPQPRYPHFTMHGGMGGGYGGGMGGGFGGGYGMPQRPPMYGGGFGGGFGGMGGGYGQMPQRPPMYGGGMGGGFGGGFGGMGGGYGQMPQPPMYGGGRGGFGGGYGMPQRPPMYGGGMGGGGRGGYGGGMGGGFEAYRRNFNDEMSRGINTGTRMMPDGSMVY